MTELVAYIDALVLFGAIVGSVYSMRTKLTGIEKGITALTDKVKEQNSRVGALEITTARLDERDKLHGFDSARPPKK